MSTSNSTVYMKSGTTFRPTKEGNMDIHTTLPPGNYLIKVDPFGNFFLDAIDTFSLPSKVYGDVTKNSDRILSTYLDRPASTGVLLTGEKGSGKTLLTKTICNKGISLGYPTIIINTPFNGDKFNELIQGIHQPCIVLFDEFEKVYDKEQQEGILTLLDGVFPTKKLFLFTCNNRYAIDTNMINRPGRIFYLLDYKGIEGDFIREYCNDNLKDNLKQYIDLVCQVSMMFFAFNFDMLKAMVEDMNRYDESPQEVLKFVNASPESENIAQEFDVSLLFIKGIEIPSDMVHNRIISTSPLSQKMCHIDIYYTVTEKAPDEEDELTCSSDEGRCSFGRNDLIKLDTAQGKFIYVNSDGDKLVLLKKKVEYSRFSVLS